ncbi:FAD-dependent thymidylate synthase, partial [bacterium]|nr:FAD-dependent thymidylate synthase [bacterium]
MSEAKLVWITPGAERIISYCARVSNPVNQENQETAPKLLAYCIKNRHWSIFEMANMCVEVNTTRAISAQFIRHRSFTIQEFSTRYQDAGVLGEAKVPHLRRQDVKNRQNSIDDLPDYLKLTLLEDIRVLFEQSQRVYNRLLDKGVAKECARFVLPLATPTRLYMTGSVRSWIHYINLRAGH